MKMILILIFSFSAHANYIKPEKIGSCNDVKVYMKKSLCGSDCVKLSLDYSCHYYESADEMEDDKDKPIYSKNQVVSCGENCQAEWDAENMPVCIDPQENAILNLESQEMYCSKLDGYEQKPTGNKIAVENSSLKSAYEAEQASKSAMENALKQAKYQMECGKDVIALLSVRNVPKGLSEAQMETLVSTYSLTKSLLESGALETAKAKINSMTPDGTIVTEDDKTALVAKIDECLGL